MIDCARAAEVLSGAIDGHPHDPALEEAVADHLDGCPACARLARELSSIHRLLLEDRVKAIEEAPRAVPRRRTRRSGFEPRLNPVPVAAAAAAVLAFLLVVAIAQRGTSGPSPVVRRMPPAVPQTAEPPRPDREPERASVPEVETPPVLPERAPVPPRPQPPPPQPAPELPPVRPPPTPAPLPAPTVAPVAVVDALEGAVKDVEGRAIQAGAGLAAGHGLETEAGSSAVLRFPDGTRVSLGASTRVEDAGEMPKQLRLVRGVLEAVVARQPEGFPMRLETPHGRAEVLGTTLRVVVDAATRLEVSEGRVRLSRADGRSAVVVAGHFAVVAPGVEPVARPLAGPAPTDRLWIAAAGPGTRLSPPMAAAPFAGTLGGRALFAATDNRQAPAARRLSERTLKPDGDDGGWAAYTIRVPREGEWFLWARIHAPGGGVLYRSPDGSPDDPNSFYVRVDDGPERVLGNVKLTDYYGRWYWGGDGAVERGRPRALALGRLSAGAHVIRVRNRDAVEDARLKLSPRLDVLCLTRDSAYVPRDEDVVLPR